MLKPHPWLDAAKKIVVLYHKNCSDGFGAAWVIHKMCPDIEAIPVSYGDEVPPAAVAEDVDLLIIVDFTFPRAVMRELGVRTSEQRPRLIVIDHHKTALENCADLPFSDRGVLCWLDQEHSGAVLTWDFLVSSESGQRRRTPWLLLYIEDRDLWAFNLALSKEINAAIYAESQDFAVWDQLAEAMEHPDRLREIAASGQGILLVQAKEVERALQNAGAVRIPHGSGWWTVPCVNSRNHQSEIGHALCKRFETLFAAVYWDCLEGDHLVRRWSLRGDGGVDCAGIARSMGGGGHQNAAGFEEYIAPGGFLLSGPRMDYAPLEILPRASAEGLKERAPK